MQFSILKRDSSHAYLLTFLLSYLGMCRRTGLQLPKLFQEQLIWEPKGEELRRVRAMFGKHHSIGADSGVVVLPQPVEHVESWDTRTLTTTTEGS